MLGGRAGPASGRWSSSATTPPAGAIALRRARVGRGGAPARSSRRARTISRSSSTPRGRRGGPRACRARTGITTPGALAHVIQCGYEWGERTLGVMPLYHTMGIHSLTSMAAVNGCFVCQPDWSAAAALAADRGRAAHRALPDPDALLGAGARPGARRGPTSPRCEKLAYAGAPMLARAHRGVRQGLPPRRLREPLRLDRDLHVLGLPRRPRQARLRGPGRAFTRRSASWSPAPSGASDPTRRCRPARRGEIIASLDSDEAFAGYWNRPDADAQGAARGLVLHRRHGLRRRRRRPVRVPGAWTT